MRWPSLARSPPFHRRVQLVTFVVSNFQEVMLKKGKRNGDMNFKNVFYLTQQIPNITILIWHQYKKILRYFCHLFSHTKSSKSNMHFILAASTSSVIFHEHNSHICIRPLQILEVLPFNGGCKPQAALHVSLSSGEASNKAGNQGCLGKSVGHVWKGKGGLSGDKVNARDRDPLKLP